VQIFATDIDDHALQIARSGIYPQGAVRDLPEETLNLYIAKQANTYRINKEIREMCIFSMHNLIKDAPFSKLDLISNDLFRSGSAAACAGAVPFRLAPARISFSRGGGEHHAATEAV